MSVKEVPLTAKAYLEDSTSLSVPVKVLLATPTELSDPSAHPYIITSCLSHLIAKASSPMEEIHISFDTPPNPSDPATATIFQWTSSQGILVGPHASLLKEALFYIEAFNATSDPSAPPPSDSEDELNRIKVRISLLFDILLPHSATSTCRVLAETTKDLPNFPPLPDSGIIDADIVSSYFIPLLATVGLHSVSQYLNELRSSKDTAARFAHYLEALGLSDSASPIVKDLLSALSKGDPS